MLNFNNQIMYMSIFQSTVVTKHLNGQNNEIITAKWNIYKNHFLDKQQRRAISRRIYYRFICKCFGLYQKPNYKFQY